MSAEDFDFSEDAFAERCLKHDANTQAAAWIDPAPVWEPSNCWIGNLHHLSHKAKKWPEQLNLSLRLRLPGGADADELRLHAEFRRASRVDALEFPYIEKAGGTRITVALFDGQRLRRFHSGTIDAGKCEMQRAYVTGVPKDVAERVASLVRQIASVAPTLVLDADDKVQLLAAINPHRADRLRCMACSRPLSDEVSKAIGIGPDCALKLGVPHTLKEAGRALSSKGGAA